jgi:hypothetical protein
MLLSKGEYTTMLAVLRYFDVVCPTCGWAVCWLGDDPERDAVFCPSHPGTRSAFGVPRSNIDILYNSRGVQGAQFLNAYGAIQVTPDIINEWGTAELWRGKRNGFPA